MDDINRYTTILSEVVWDKYASYSLKDSFHFTYLVSLNCSSIYPALPATIDPRRCISVKRKNSTYPLHHFGDPVHSSVSTQLRPIIMPSSNRNYDHLETSCGDEDTDSLASKMKLLFTIGRANEAKYLGAILIISCSSGQSSSTLLRRAALSRIAKTNWGLIGLL